MRGPPPPPLPLLLEKKKKEKTPSLFFLNRGDWTRIILLPLLEREREELGWTGCCRLEFNNRGGGRDASSRMLIEIFGMEQDGSRLSRLNLRSGGVVVSEGNSKKGGWSKEWK